jgi:hypothetical protein
MILKTTHKLSRALALVGLFALLLVGCGGGGGSSSSGAVGGGKDIAEPSKEFHDPEGPKGPEPVATFGKEAGDADRKEASAVLSANLTARQKADFATQCKTLGKRGLESFLGSGKGAQRSKCKKELKKLAEPLSGSKKIRADTLSGEIAALRVKGNQAWALFHGSDGKDNAMPMEREDGVWKVGAILTTELPGEKPESKSSKSQTPKKKKNG